MTKAFTLIEVLVSVTILAVVATGLLQISTNSKHNFSFLKEKSEFSRLASIALVHNDQKYHNKEMALFDFLRDDYDNIEDELRNYLKKTKVKYTHEEVSSFSPLSSSLDDQNQSQYEEQNPQSALNITILYDQITVSKDKNIARAYKIYVPMGR